MAEKQTKEQKEQDQIERVNMLYHRPVCVKCRVDMRPEMNGVGLLDMAAFGPYKVWDADLWKCPECGVEVVVGAGQHAIAHHNDGNFDKVCAGYRQRTLLIPVRFSNPLSCYKTRGN